MGENSETAVLRAIAAMQERLDAPITVADLAREAMFSKFHFTRMFQRVTGVSPGRFLAALRLQRAKELLVATSMKVADISISVGYTSVGTFSTRFSRNVGMSPTTYRRRAGHAPGARACAEAVRFRSAHLTCHVRSPRPDPDAVIFVGLFADPVPEGRPVRCAVLRQADRIVFDNPPPGSWYLLAQAVTIRERGAGPVRDRTDRPASVGAAGPITIRPHVPVSTDLVLQPAGALDAPVLRALLDVRMYALSLVSGDQPDATGTLTDAA
ncbi:AraC family transcriptional regulator [Micromonospora sp. WMMD1082]|uniref:helix-turn-helix domain-containing protein n=1 Tax=Micromonospora sp. WMMD1082 TaxID=3016104 RepID=UPI002417CFF0|nr:AraC family transcriptional regulator [Micromonospora sp. WMMD1082]MDG4793443.1 AraC family transcriptional regulator [Micromonospora sp. WMMD1082]